MSFLKILKAIPEETDDFEDWHSQRAPRPESGKYDDDHLLGSSKPTANDENL
jgi:hypothetical protein